MKLSEDMVKGNVCPVCGKSIDKTNKDSYYDAYRYDGVILSDGYSIMVEDHGPHLCFHCDCTVGIKDNGHGLYDIVIDNEKYWDKDNKSYEEWINRNNTQYIEEKILSLLKNQFPHHKFGIENTYEDTDSRFVSVYGVKPEDMIKVENDIWHIIDPLMFFDSKIKYIPSVISLSNTKRLYPDMLPDDYSRSREFFNSIKRWFIK